MVAHPQSSFADRLAQIRARGARLRCEAFVDYRPTVCGLELNPVTLDSYNRLTAFDNPFATGAPVTEADVLVWVWVHHPEFGQRAVAAKKRVIAAAWRALHPRFPNLNALVCLFATLPRFRRLARFRRKPATERLEDAAAEIRRLMTEAIYGFPLAQEDDQHEIEEDDDGPKLPRKNERFSAGAAVAFQAQLLNTFCRVYGLTYAETEALPLKRLAQLWREHLFSTQDDKTGLRMMDREEAELWRQQLPDEPAEKSNG